MDIKLDENKQCCHDNQIKLSQQLKETWKSYKPLIIVFLYSMFIPLVTDNNSWMNGFMAYFFIFLSLFKLFDLKGFKDSFSNYDLVAKKFKFYGFLYPFIELFLGLAYLAEFNLISLNWLTLIVMSLGAMSVMSSLISKQKIKCACLGTALNVPLSTVSLVENFGMAIMAAYQLFF